MGSRYTFESRVATSSSTLNYTDTFKDMHNLNLMAGFEVENRDLLQIVTVPNVIQATIPNWPTDNRTKLQVQPWEPA